MILFVALLWGSSAEARWNTPRSTALGLQQMARRRSDEKGRPSGVLLICRHGESETNQEAYNCHTGGGMNVGITPKGRGQSRQLGRQLLGVPIRSARSGTLARQRRSLREALGHERRKAVEPRAHKAFNERHYGVLTGAYKEFIKYTFGEEQVERWQNTLHEAPYGAEPLLAVARRVVKEFDRDVLPALRRGENVMLMMSKNSARVLMAYLEGVIAPSYLLRAASWDNPPIRARKEIFEAMKGFGLGNGQVEAYAFDRNGAVQSTTRAATNRWRPVRVVGRGGHGLPKIDQGPVEQTWVDPSYGQEVMERIAAVRLAAAEEIRRAANDPDISAPPRHSGPDGGDVQGGALAPIAAALAK